MTTGRLLTVAEFRSRLTLNSPELVKELYDLAQRQVQTEIERMTRLDSKATSLLTAAGLCLIVAFMFGSTLITKPEVFAISHQGVIAFAIALALGMIAAILGAFSLLVTDRYLGINEYAVFDSDGLDNANDPLALRSLREEEMADAEKRKFGVMEFQKYMVEHLWKISQQNGQNNECKARIIKWGQGLFMCFLGALSVVVFFAVNAATK
jgi:hypothetical protein